MGKEEYQIRDGILESYRGRETCVEVPKGVHTIGEGAFKACVSLREVILPAGLRTIGSRAFKGCRKLEKIEIPSGVSIIGDYAFHRCHGLRQAALPESVEELGDCAFLYCDSLTQVRMPGVKRLGKQAFVNDVLLERLEISNDLQKECICDVFTGCGKIREIAFADGEVCRIANVVEALLGKKDLPVLVRTIAVDVLRMMELEGSCLLRFLTNLKHVEIPEGIESLAKSCFFDKRGIISVVFPKSLKEIGSRAFRNCINLERVVFQGEEVQIREDAFKNCSSLRYICTGEGETYELSGIHRLQGEQTPKPVQAIHRQVLGNFRISGTILLKYLGSEPRVAVPDGITRIAGDAFAGNEAIDRVILPESVREIGAEAFRNCLLLQTIRFPEKLERIGDGAFENCVNLLRAELPPGLSRIEAGTFRRCEALGKVFFPEGLREIGESAFYACSSLRNIQFPQTLASIGEMAFYRCAGLREIRLSPHTEYVGSLAFAGSGIKKAWVFGSGRNYGTDLFGGCVRLETLVLGEGVQHIPDKFAFGCTGLKQVILPASLKSAGRHVWEDTVFLEEIRQEGGQAGNVFWDGRDLEGAVRIPQSVQIIAGGAFYGNKKVTAVDLPEQVHWIGPAAFKGCEKLRRVSVPAGMRDLEAEVFSGCRELESVTGYQRENFRLDKAFPIWRSVGARAFYRCRNLRRICLEQAETVGKEAFAGCRMLERSAVQKLCRVGEGAFESTVYMESSEGMAAVVGCVAVGGSENGVTLRLPDGVTGIAPYAFAGNHRIADVILPDSLEWIGEGAFYGCKGIKKVYFPRKLKKIGRRAFEKCISLQKAEAFCIQAEAFAFAGCRMLKKAVLPRITVLEESLFAGCRELEACICKNAKTVQPRCFSGCGKLEVFSLQKVSVIRAYAFEGCRSLHSMEFQDGVCLMEHAMEDCGALEEMILSGAEGRIYLSEYALSGCTALRRVICQGKEWAFRSFRDILREEIPEMVRLIFDSAMSCFEVDSEEILKGYRGAGETVVIPEGIKKIEAEVFRDRLMLRKLSIPQSVEYIGARAFHGTAWMEQKRRESPLVVINHMLLDGSACCGNVTVPEDIRLVCGWAFANGMGITGIRFLSAEVRVEEYAFRNCIFLREMILPDGVSVKITGIEDRKRELPPLAKQAVMDSMNCFKTDANGTLVECTGNISRLRLAAGITAVGEGAFQDGNLLTEILLADTVRVIRRRAFAGCKWLQIVRGADRVTEIEERAFSGCGVLKRVELSERLVRIGVRAFENCTSLEEILLPEGMEEIPDQAFYRCHSLRKVRFPSTLKRIGREAFAFCRELREIVIPEGTVVEARAFAGCTGLKDTVLQR